MTSHKDTATQIDDPSTHYEVRLEGHIGDQWSMWFQEMHITREGTETRLSGPVIDQAALYGLLRKIRDLGLPLISVTRLASQDQGNKKNQTA